MLPQITVLLLKVAVARAQCHHPCCFGFERHIPFLINGMLFSLLSTRRTSCRAVGAAFYCQRTVHMVDPLSVFLFTPSRSCLSTCHLGCNFSTPLRLPLRRASPSTCAYILPSAATLQHCATPDILPSPPHSPALSCSPYTSPPLPTCLLACSMHLHMHLHKHMHMLMLTLMLMFMHMHMHM